MVTYLKGAIRTATYITGTNSAVTGYYRIAKMSLDAYLGKKYKLDTSENFDEYMKALGVGLVTRKMGNTVSPVADLNKDGDEYVLSSVSTFKNVVIKFKPGVELEYESPDGVKVHSTFTVEGNVVTEVQKRPDGKVTTITRTWTDDDIKMVMTVGDITATRIYKVQA